MTLTHSVSASNRALPIACTSAPPLGIEVIQFLAWSSWASVNRHKHLIEECNAKDAEECNAGMSTNTTLVSVKDRNEH